MSILTPAELRSLVLTLAFLAVGAGARLWQRSQVRLGPYMEDPAGTAAAVPPATDAAAADSRAAGAAGSLPPPVGIPAMPPGPPSPRDGADAGRPDPPHSDTAHAETAPVGPFGSGSAEDLAATAQFPGDRSLLVHASLSAPTPAPPSASGARPPRPSRPAARRGNQGGAAPRKTSTVKVALNLADVAELARVPGIGEKIAQAILAYRKAHGPFLDLRELLHVKGIGEKKLERIAPCLVLSPVREEEPARQAGLPP